MDRRANQGCLNSIQVRQERARTHAVELAPVIAELRSGGATTLQAIATGLNARGISATRGGRWTPMAVKRVLAWALSNSGPDPSGEETEPAGLTEGGRNGEAGTM
ncbi:recombinase-like helix-turn-helix domain-containing protein [Methylobacterium terricola]|uniref:recombinase-like helix-turn-helix domain-containing protein n=1 Tax=Methylobacterium terricola TaxID=2583531 RepID=UPI003CCC4C9E